MGTGRFAAALCAAALSILSLSACSSGPDRFAFIRTSSSFTPVVIHNNVSMPRASLTEYTLANIAPAAGTEVDGAALQGGAQDRCSIGRRFDRKAVLAYEFDGGQARLGLNMGIRGPGFRDPARFDVRHVKINFRYRFEPDERARKHPCRYQSAWQGLLGTGYNELFVRQDDTVYQQLDDEIDQAEDRVAHIFR